MLSKYILFSYMPHCAEGGWGDFICDSNNLQELMCMAKEQTNVYGKNSDIVSNETKEVIFHVYALNGEVHFNDSRYVVGGSQIVK